MTRAILLLLTLLPTTLVAQPAPAPSPLGSIPGLPTTGVPMPAAGAPPSSPSAPIAQESPAPAYSSLFFGKDTLEELTKLRITHSELLKQGLEVPKEAPNTPAAQPTQQSFTYPQFFLSSIVYHNPQEWTLWVNGAKLTPQQNTLNQLTVIAVSEHAAQFVFKAEESSPYDFAITQASGVSLEPEARIARFSLSQNQTFTSYGMRIYEGHVQPKATLFNPNQHVIDKLKKEEASVESAFPSDTASKE